MNKDLPYWLDSTWQFVLSALIQKKMHHALLIEGKKGVGKKRLAFKIIQAIVCERQNACNQCDACVHLKKNYNAYVFSLKTEHQQIKIDEVRYLIEQVSKTCYLNEQKFVIIYDVQKLNDFSANALLKMIEEPTEKTYFFLLYDLSVPLLPTIISRCQRLSCTLPMKDKLRQYYQSLSTWDYWCYVLGGPMVLKGLSEEQKKMYVLFLSEIQQSIDSGCVSIVFVDVDKKYLDIILRILYFQLYDILKNNTQKGEFYYKIMVRLSHDIRFIQKYANINDVFSVLQNILYRH